MIHNKVTAGLPEKNRYDLTRPKWTEFYQKLEDAVSTFGFNESVWTITARYNINVAKKLKREISS